MDTNIRDASYDDLKQALLLAVNIIMQNEPGDSRAVSNEAVAIAAVSCDLVTDETLKVIKDALNAIP